jgi:FkbM family methyltransferase
MSLRSKFQSVLGLIAFLRRYPEAEIVGGPNALTWLGVRHSSRPSGFFSQNGQDAYLLTRIFPFILAPGFPRTFVDVGCNHPVKHNNSLFFERYMGFKVLAVDALPTHQAVWAEQRPDADLVITAVGSREGAVEFEEVEHAGREGDMFSSVSGVSDKAKALGRRIRTVPVTTLTKILQSRGITSVGVMSIDIEGYELHALLGIDFDAIKISAIILENNTNSVFGDNRIRDFLIGKNYRFTARIWGMDDVFVHKHHSLQELALR